MKVKKEYIPKINRIIQFAPKSKTKYKFSGSINGPSNEIEAKRILIKSLNSELSNISTIKVISNQSGGYDFSFFSSKQEISYSPEIEDNSINIDFIK